MKENPFLVSYRIITQCGYQNHIKNINRLCGANIILFRFALLDGQVLYGTPW